MWLSLWLSRNLNVIMLSTMSGSWFDCNSKDWKEIFEDVAPSQTTNVSNWSKSLWLLHSLSIWASLLCASPHSSNYLLNPGPKPLGVCDNSISAIFMVHSMNFWKFAILYRDILLRNLAANRYWCNNFLQKAKGLKLDIMTSHHID